MVIKAVKRLLSLHIGEEQPEKVREDIIKNISFRGANVWILACAIFIASIGLNVNSTAVIIGAMLISPLMGPIVGIGFALATYDVELLKRSGKNLLRATLVGFVVSSVYFYLSPFKEVQSELLARTSPTIYDVMIAFLGGIVGAISITRVDKGNPIPGVAIATALMPPLCTAGFGLASLSFKFVAGALYLYAINCFFIALSTFLVIKYLKYKPVETENKILDKKVKYVIYILMLLMIVPSSYLAYNLLQEKQYSQNVDDFITDEFVNKGFTVIYKNVNYNSNPKTIELAFLSKKIDSAEVNLMREKLPNYQIFNTKLLIRQDASDLKTEILSEINKSSNQLTQRDIQLSQLAKELATYKRGDKQLDTEVRLLFPEIDEISFGTVTDYRYKDSLKTIPIIVYRAEKQIDEAKLSEWMKLQFDVAQVKVIYQQKN